MLKSKILFTDYLFQKKKKKKKFATAKFIMPKEKSVILWYVPKATDVKEIIRTLLTVILKQK